MKASPRAALTASQQDDDLHTGCVMHSTLSAASRTQVTTPVPSSLQTCSHCAASSGPPFAKAARDWPLGGSWPLSSPRAWRPHATPPDCAIGRLLSWLA